MPGWTSLHYRVFCDCSMKEDSANIMLSLPSFPIKLIKVFAQLEWQNWLVQTAIEENCNGHLHGDGNIISKLRKRWANYTYILI
jgi:hypothetical protein